MDAALVYKTDVIAAGDKGVGINFPEAAQAVNEYPIARLYAAARVQRIYGGTNEIMKELIGRDLGL